MAPYQIRSVIHVVRALKNSAINAYPRTLPLVLQPSSARFLTASLPHSQLASSSPNQRYLSTSLQTQQPVNTNQADINHIYPPTVDSPQHKYSSAPSFPSFKHANFTDITQFSNHRRRFRSETHSFRPLSSSRSSLARPNSSPRIRTGIQKRPSIRPRSFSSSSKSPNTISQQRVTWRQALQSPFKAAKFSAQLWRSLVDWGKHMWAGAKLLAADVRVSSKVLRKITTGKQISRRERNFIVKTGVDLARLVPFSLFLIIPLAEFALPFALRLFPNMLPSQFQDQMKSEENLRRRLKGRLGLAQYLRDVVEEKAKMIKASDANSDLKKEATDLTDFLDSIRSGKYVDASEVARFARFFNDELTIEGAARPQLIAMCKYMGISPYGHDLFLRFKLRSKLNGIKRDDMEIMWEGGVESLTDEEVSKACQDRGIREVDTRRMRRELSDWLDLSQSKEIPGSLLIMSRAFLYTTDLEAKEKSNSDGLVETLGSLSEDVIMDAKKAADVGDETTVERLAETLRQAQLIEVESQREAQKEKEDKEKRKKKETEEEAIRAQTQLSTEAQEQGDQVPDEPIADKAVMDKVRLAEDKLSEAIIGVSGGSGSAPESLKAKLELPEEAEMDEEEEQKERDGIREMLESLEALASDSAVEKERDELRDLKIALSSAETTIRVTEGVESADFRRLKGLVSRLEREIERVDTKVGLRMKLLDKDNDGLMSLNECKDVMKLIAGERDDELVEETLQKLDADDDGNISREDLKRVLREMQFDLGSSEGQSQKLHSSKVPNESTEERPREADGRQ